MNIEAEEIRRRMPAIITNEIAAINKAFAGRALGAMTKPAWVTVAGRSYISFGLKLAPTVLPQDIEKLLPKLSEALSALRRRPTDVRLRRKPLALEVNHPFPAPLDWHKANTQLPPDTMLAGRNYSGGEPCDDTLCFDDTPHVLIVGTTGSGKSTLLRMMIATLAYNTDPDLCRIFLIDLKNEDLLPFRRLPHVETTAITRAQAMDVVRYMHAEKNRRVLEGKTTGPRCVLVIDELAQIADKSTVQLLDDTLAVARSKRINAVFATQKPTVDVVGRLGKANLTTRLVGRVTTSDEAATAAGRGETGAHLLPGKGAFLRIEGAGVTRLQAYWLDDGGTEAMVDAAVQRWGKQARVPVYHQDAGAISAPYWPTPQREIVGGTSGTRAVQPVEVVRSVPVAAGVRFPIPDRPLTATEAAAVRRMYAGGLANGGRSKNSVITEVWGGLENKPKRLAWFDEAIEGGAA